MFAEMKVSVVIPNYNTWDLVKRNIDALLQYDSDWIDEIIVVDDCSPIANPFIFSEKVRIIRNSENLHYTRTVNRGLRAARGAMIILLDSDAYPVHPFVARLMEEYKTHPRLGCVGFKTVDEQGRDSGNYMTEPSVWSLVAGQQLHQYLSPFYVFRSKRILPFSCAVSFRKDCLEAMDYLDESFRVLDADNDISMRVHRSSWQLQYSPHYVICHTGGHSIPRDGKRVQLFYESRWHLLEKHKIMKATHFFAFLIMMRLWLETQLLALKKSKGDRQKNKWQTRKYLVEYFRNLI